jgi:hypothetical protein
MPSLYQMKFDCRFLGAKKQFVSYILALIAQKSQLNFQTEYSMFDGAIIAYAYPLTIERQSANAEYLNRRMQLVQAQKYTAEGPANQYLGHF